MMWLWALIALAPVFVFLIWSLLAPRAKSVSFQSRHVLITGGSSGIGLAIAMLSAVEGARVTLLARDHDKLEVARNAIVDYCNAHPSKNARDPQVAIQSANVKNFNDVERAIATAVEKAGTLDILICSHGVAVPMTLLDTSVDNMMHEIDTNLKGNIHVIKAAVPHMLSRTSADPACISIVSSLAGQAGLYGYTSYSASKFGLRGLAEVLQQELLPHNIRVSVIYPPDTKTPGFIEENKTKPALTVELSGTSSCMDSMDVAKKAMAGLKAGRYGIYCNIEGYLLGILTAGAAPETTLLDAVLEVACMGFIRFIYLFILRGFYRTIMDWHRNQAKDKAK